MLPAVDTYISGAIHYFKEIDIQGAIDDDFSRVQYITMAIVHTLKNNYYYTNKVLASNIKQEQKEDYLTDLNEILLLAKNGLERVNVLPKKTTN